MRTSQTLPYRRSSTPEVNEGAYTLVLEDVSTTHASGFEVALNESRSVGIARALAILHARHLEAAPSTDQPGRFVRWCVQGLPWALRQVQDAVNECQSGNLSVADASAFRSSFANFESVQAVYTDDRSTVTSDFLTFPVPFITTVEADSYSADFKFQKSFSFFGDHDVTFGGYVTHYNYDMFFQAGFLVSDVSEDSRLVDLLAVDSAGNQIGPSLTDRGVFDHSLFGRNSDAAFMGYAAYALEHYEGFNDRLKVDVGIRYQRLDVDVVNRDYNVVTDQTPGDVAPGSTDDTLADDGVNVPGNPQFQSDSFDAVGWSIGANYRILENLAVYAGFSDSFRLPSPEDVVFRGSATNQTAPSGNAIDLEQVESIIQVEIGARFQWESVSASLALFYNDFSSRDRASAFRDFTDGSCAVPNGVPVLENCPIIDEVFNEGVTNYGFELEAAWRPRKVLKGLQLVGNLVWQQPEFDGTSRTGVEAIVDDQGTTTGYEFISISSDGRRPRRLSEVLLNVRPMFDFEPLTGVPLTIFGQALYFSERFAESNDIDVTVYPAYLQLNAGALFLLH